MGGVHLSGRNGGVAWRRAMWEVWKPGSFGSGQEPGRWRGNSAFWELRFERQGQFTCAFFPSPTSPVTSDLCEVLKSLRLDRPMSVRTRWLTWVRNQVWDRKSGKMLHDLSGSHLGRIFSVVGDKLRVVSSGLDCRINIWDFGEGLDTAFVQP